MKNDLKLKNLHEKAMDLAEEAYLLSKKDATKSLELFELAYQNELEVYNEMLKNFYDEKSKSIILKSAVNLAISSHKYNEAKNLINDALSRKPLPLNYHELLALKEKAEELVPEIPFNVFELELYFNVFTPPRISKPHSIRLIYHLLEIIKENIYDEHIKQEIEADFPNTFIVHDISTDSQIHRLPMHPIKSYIKIKYYSETLKPEQQQNIEAHFVKLIYKNIKNYFDSRLKNKEIYSRRAPIKKIHDFNLFDFKIKISEVTMVESNFVFPVSIKVNSAMQKV